MKLSAVLALMTVCEIFTYALAEEANYDESKVPNYTLPDSLTLKDGTKVMTPLHGGNAAVRRSWGCSRSTSTAKALED